MALVFLYREGAYVSWLWLSRTLLREYVGYKPTVHKIYGRKHP